MFPASHLLAFALLSFALIIVPGPNVLFVVSRSLMLGRLAGVGTAAGGQCGVYLQVVAVAFGVGAMVERSVAVFTVIKLAGAAISSASACRPSGTAARCARAGGDRPAQELRPDPAGRDRGRGEQPEGDRVLRGRAAAVR